MSTLERPSKNSSAPPLDQIPAHVELHAAAVAFATDAMARAFTGPDGKFLPQPARPEAFTVREVFRLCINAFEAGATHALKASRTWNR